MQVSYTFVHLDPSPAIENYALEKLAFLDKLLSRHGGDVASVEVEFVRTTRHHHKGEVYQVNIRLKLPRKQILVSETGEDIRATLDAAKNKLHQTVERYKELIIQKARV
ncbi:MAG: ribosome-associated translation inhibitor RaiA [Candidatus Liptonbacteria bacterium]|nr:ribosome-associated translation inhibitor RaiA [Candidatus Liptonbacteria bacterium]